MPAYDRSTDAVNFALILLQLLQEAVVGSYDWPESLEVSPGLHQSHVRAQVQEHAQNYRRTAGDPCVAIHQNWPASSHVLLHP